jgi:hypothetical protein
MGIKSTYDIDRSTAISIILSKVHSCTNEQLEAMLECFEESYFRNYNVYDILPDDDEENDRIIKDVRDF